MYMYKEVIKLKEVKKIKKKTKKIQNNIFTK